MGALDTVMTFVVLVVIAIAMRHLYLRLRPLPRGWRRVDSDRYERDDGSSVYRENRGGLWQIDAAEQSYGHTYFGQFEYPQDAMQVCNDVFIQ